MGKNKFICEYCGKEFYDYFEVMHFCSKECFHASQKEKTKQICQYCGKEFNRKHSGQKFCSRECRNLSMRKRIECTCDNCGKEMSVPPNAYNNANHHFCSKACKVEFFGWTDEEIQYLKDNYGIKSYEEMINEKLLVRDARAISKKAVYLGIAVPREWSHEEEEIVRKYYSTIPFEELQKMLPNRTESAIRSKAKQFNLLSNYTILNRFSINDTDFIRKNYLTMSDNEIANKLNRTVLSIQNKRRNEGLTRPKEPPTCYNNLAEMIRSNLDPWKKKIMEENNFTCQLTGIERNVVVHHKLGFNLIMEEAINKINFEVKESMSDYNADELLLLLHTFLELQDSYSEYVCINENVHKLFHKIYGYGDNTPEQFDEFERDFKTGKYDDYIEINKQ